MKGEAEDTRLKFMTSFSIGSLSGGNNLKMEVIRRRCPAFRPVIEDRPIRAEIDHELEKGSDPSRDRLWFVRHEGDRTMKRENGHRVGEKKVRDRGRGLACCSAGKVVRDRGNRGVRPCLPLFTGARVLPILPGLCCTSTENRAH